MNCPCCNEVLFRVKQIQGTPFTAKHIDDPVIDSEPNGYFCTCSHCSSRLQLLSSGGAFQLHPIQPERKK